MDQLRQVLGTIRKHLGQLKTTDMIQVASLVVIAILVFTIVSLMAGKPSHNELLPGVDAAGQERAYTSLRNAGIDASFKGGKVLVSEAEERRARAHLVQNRELPTDKTVLFETMFDRQNWQMSRQQNDQLFMTALRNELGRTIEDLRGIRTARVILDDPPVSGLGNRVRQPTASVVVTTEGDAPLAQSTVDSIAHWVAGSRSGLTLDRVSVIEASNTNRVRRATSQDDMVSSTYLDYKNKMEQDRREALSELLAYIPGVIVAVTADVDVTRVSTQTERNLEKGNGTVVVPRSKTESSTNQTDAQGSASPGIAANVGTDPTRGGVSGTRVDQNETRLENEVRVGTERSTIQDPRGMPLSLAVSVNVPRGYVVSLLQKKQGDGAEAAEPTDQEIETKFALEQKRIEASLKPHVQTRGPDGKPIDGDVVVSLIPVDIALPQAAGDGGGIMNMLGGGGGWAGSGLVDKVLLGGLALVAMGLMVTMVRKAGRRVEMPSAEELVGLPPQLEAKSDLIGEADESEAAMAGIEVDEGQVHSQKVLEQVGDLVKQKPDAAARLMNRWIQAQE